MLFSARSLSGMGAPEPALRPLSRHFPQWSRTAILTITGSPEEETNDLKKSPPAESSSGFIIGGGDAVARVAHLEHSVRFLQEQHRQMLSGLHSEIEALRERNRDLQFQLIFNKESSPKPTTPANEESSESAEEANLKREVSRLEREAAAARSEARAAEARALQLQRLLDAQAEKLRELESRQCSNCGSTQTDAAAAAEAREAALSPGAVETRAELRARLAEAERLVRRLRADAERQRRELQCMKNSLHASLRASGLDAPYGYQNSYHFPPVHTPDFWREPLREDFNMVGSRGRSTRRPLTLPELSGQQIHRSTVYANSKPPPHHYPTLIHHWTYRDLARRLIPEPLRMGCIKNHTRPRANGYDHKNKRAPPTSVEAENKSPEEQTAAAAAAGVAGVAGAAGGAGGDSARRARRHHHRKQTTDHT